MSYNVVGAIDQGTTSTRFILFRSHTGGQIEYSAQVEHKQHYPQAGWVEHDPMEILNNTIEVMEECFDHCDDLSAVCYCCRRCAITPAVRANIVFAIAFFSFLFCISTTYLNNTCS
jgi:glycerol kinase